MLYAVEGTKSDAREEEMMRKNGGGEKQRGKDESQDK